MKYHANRTVRLHRFGILSLMVVGGTGKRDHDRSLSGGGNRTALLRATHEHHDGVHSSIVWSYGHVTIPRHLRDIFITEYGIADLRGKTDSEVIAAMLNIADSRFQPSLLEEAKKAGKIAHDYEIPDAFRHNTPERLEQALAPHRKDGHFPPFPFGHDFTPEELAEAQRKAQE